MQLGPPLPFKVTRCQKKDLQSNSKKGYSYELTNIGNFMIR